MHTRKLAFAAPLAGASRLAQAGGRSLVSAGVILLDPMPKTGHSLWPSRSHQMESARRAAYRGVADDVTVVLSSSTGQDGALASWRHPSKRITTGLTYRYSKAKPGMAAREDAFS